MAEHAADIVTRDEYRAYTDEEVRALAGRLEVHGDFSLESYVPPGPVADAFIDAPEPTAVIMGPLGGGKTTACVFSMLAAGAQAPIAWHPEDKKPTRMTRWIVLRDTFRSAEKTVLASWRQWFPKNYPGSSSEGGNDRPYTHTLRFMGEDDVRIEVIVEFAGLQGFSIGDLMKGREYSGAWLNELDTHAEGALDDMEQRVGRYPRADILLTEGEIEELQHRLRRRLHAPRSRLARVIGDMNAPTIDNWTYKAMVTDRTPGRGFYKQPSGRSPQAENRFNLEPDYYDRIIENQDEHFVRRMVDNEFGYSRAGKPVHPTFRHDRHVGRLRYRPDLDLLIGIDVSTNALTPAAVLGQVQPSGRIGVLEEIAFDHGYGPARFGEAVKRRIDERYFNARAIRGWADPASQYGGDREGGQLAAIDMLNQILGLVLQIPFGGSNELALRLDAVNVELRGWTDADTSLLIDPSCRRLIEALAGRYRFKKLTDKASTDYADEPEKSHPWSDLCDALQYLVGGIRGRQGTMRGIAGRGRLAAAGESSSGGWGKSRAASFDPHRF